MGSVHKGIPEKFALKIMTNRSLQYFVETGTYMGRTTAWAAKNFGLVHTIDLSQDFINKAKANCAGFSNVRFYTGNSGDILHDVLRAVPEPALIWLDAHWSRDLGYGRPELGECPVLEEIAAIVKDGRPHVVLIDDARYFVKPPPKPHRKNDWPGVIKISETFGVQWRVTVLMEQDVILAEPYHAETLPWLP